jgi:hypothetical protein
MWLGRNPRSAIARSTRARVCGLMRWAPLMTRETVWWETWANRATSRIVTDLREPGGAMRLSV